ncbi:hypothetical protein TVAG_264310 [Trichomonas vaginalis G3]|uniref:UDENN FLCN/SMCR8-type domain-containing protein n=1 Tax=Trichomonas vaginalis (strain ATCC PRA-98 / G3) TaxID=412133 RepID=A2FFM8_TRIV3|nr:hypothetical protein TVAGG3_1007860 [Trichomonas vaginalis G3]EAX96307.1 hypothetical protein TVAG_264310 [Trichomonas vaginalis G3]KAI5491258.1 hypothetical protein TVAGG3_1007860 [Trichomonas vaginalis G3]|eukprot:XP_001309237.1 hypothetical protein [Trichomonas vaginalis G3]
MPLSDNFNDNPQVMLSYFIFEFRQGSEPRIVSQYKYDLSDSFDDGFLWYIVSTPITQDYNPLDSATSYFYSSYENIYFACFNLIVPDVQARGFSRSFGICLYNTKRIEDKLIETGLAQRISELLTEMIQKCQENFKTEVSQYLGSIIATIDAFQDSAAVLEQKYKEATFLLNGREILPDKSQEAKTPDYFTQINNDLRAIEKIIDLNELTTKLRVILGDFYRSQISCQIKTHAKYEERFPFVNFGHISGENYSDFPSFVLENRKELNNDRYLLINLVKPKILHHIAYCLFSGHSLVIEAKRPQDLHLLAKKMSLFVPQFTDRHIHIFETPITSVDAYQYSIVVTPQFKRDRTENICILNTDYGYYEGPICPCSSSVYKLFDFTVSSESSFLLVAFERVKDFSYQIIKLYASFSRDVPKNATKLREYLGKLQISEADDQLLRFITQSIVSRGDSKVLLLNNPTFAAIGIIAYYDGK